MKSKKRKIGIIIGVIIAIIIVAVIAIFGTNYLLSKKAIKEYERVLDTYIASVREADADKLMSVIDPEATNGLDEEVLSDVIILKSLGMDIAFDHTVKGYWKATKDDVKEMCGNIYEDESISKKISRAYIFQIEATMEISYMGDGTSTTDDVYLILYKKDGNYYLGGKVGY